MQKQKRKKIILVFLIIYLISIGGSWGYFFYQQDANYDKRVIHQFLSSDSEFSELYKIENRRLVNIAEESYIYPNDRLEYRYTVVNPLEHPVRVAYEFEVFKTGERIHNESDELYLPYDDVRHSQFEFFLPEEGRYDMKVNWIFYNDTNGEKYAQYVTQERDIQVLSLANKLQNDANQLTFYGLIAVSIVGLGTIFALIMSVIFSKKEVDKLDDQNENSKLQIKLLKEQNDNVKEQYSLQNRPWIVINSLEFQFAVLDKREIPWEEYLKKVSEDPDFEIPKEVRFLISCKNVGSSPAKVIQHRYQDIKKITLEQLKQNKPTERTLFPSQEMTWLANAPYWGQEYFLGLLIEYTFEIFGQKGSDFIGTQWRYFNRNIWNIDEWSKE